MGLEVHTSSCPTLLRLQNSTLEVSTNTLDAILMKVHVTSSTLQGYPVQPQTHAAATVLVLATFTLVSSGTASASVTTTTVTMVKQLTVILHVMVMQTSCVVERGQ